MLGCEKSMENVITVSPTARTVSQPSSTKLPENTATPTEAILPATETPTLVPNPTSTQGPLAMRIPVLEYHNPSYFGGEMVKMTAEWFIEQLDWLYTYQFKTLTGVEILEFIAGSYQPPIKSVVLRFDLGFPKYDENANIVIPALRRLDFHALFFLIVPSITDDCTHPDDKICWEDLKNWEDEGLITVGSHGMDHPDYAEISKSDASDDAGVSKRILEEKLGHSINLFAYPFDSAPDRPGDILQPLKYSAGFSGSALFQDRSAVFGSQLYWEIPSYYPYSGDSYYPIITTAWPHTGFTFPDLILEAIGISDSELEILNGGISIIPTLETIQKAAATISPEKDDLLQYTWYCKAMVDKILNVDYLQSIAFSPDLSLEAQKLLKIPLLVKPICNFEKDNQPEAIVLHYTGSLASHQASVSHFRNPTSGTSAHYMVERDGTIIQLLPEGYVAHHVSCYGNPALNCLPGAPLVYDEDGKYTPPSTRSIGIEIVNAGPLVYPDKSPDILTDKFGTPYVGDIFIFEEFGKYEQFKYEFWEPYSEVQLDALEILIKDIQSRWDIDLVIGHFDLQENIDPGPALIKFIDSFK